MKVLVTDGDNRAALAVTRALGRHGHTVVVAEKRIPSLAHTSRYCSERVVYPDPVHDDVSFVRELADTVAERRIDVLLPVADITTSLVATHRGLFEPRCLVPFADAKTISRAADKVDMLRTAERLGVPTPRSCFLYGPEQQLDVDIPYPVVLKPHRSRVRTAAGWASCSVGYAHSPRELREAVGRRPPYEFPLILQERIVGPGLGIFVCYNRGRSVALFAHQRLREKPPWGGVSVMCESVEVCPHAGQSSERLMRELGWHGVAMIEFKRDRRDGLPKLMEINGRFWGSLQLAVDAGIDFPNILLGTFDEAQAESPCVYRTGIRERWFWGDVDSLLLRLRRKNPEWVPLDGRGRLWAVAQFLRMTGRDLYYDNPKWDDPAPWWHETRRHVRWKS